MLEISAWWRDKKKTRASKRLSLEAVPGSGLRLSSLWVIRLHCRGGGCGEASREVLRTTQEQKGRSQEQPEWRLSQTAWKHTFRRILKGKTNCPRLTRISVFHVSVLCSLLQHWGFHGFYKTVVSRKHLAAVLSGGREIEPPGGHVREAGVGSSNPFHTHWQTHLCKEALSSAQFLGCLFAWRASERVGSVSRPGIEPVPLRWKHRALTSGPPGDSPRFRCFCCWFLISLWSRFLSDVL